MIELHVNLAVAELIENEVRRTQRRGRCAASTVVVSKIAFSRRYTRIVSFARGHGR